MKIEDSLWTGGQVDDLADARLPTHGAGAGAGKRHIGCPLKWFALVFPIVRGKNELAVALYIYRLRIVRRSRTVTVANERLLTELGINRFAKHRALRRLADAGVIRIVQRNNGCAPVITFNPKYP